MSILNRLALAAALMAGLPGLSDFLGTEVAPRSPWAIQAQVLGEGPGVVRTGLLLRQLRGEKRVLVIAAHPDDEDTALLTTLARRDGADVAYLALTRGEGGQNLIGPEFYAGLGLVRTGELLAARQLDGARQFFTRAIDFGFSKNAAETFRQWPREEILADVVEVIRGFRPQVVIALFSGTPADGHGQHQAAGILAREAFDAAGDPTRFPEQVARGLAAWAPEALYGRARGGRGGGRGGRGGGAGRGAAPAPGTVRINTGVLDPLLGQSHNQLAAASRSQHRSQNMGRSLPLGPSASTLRFERGRAVVDGSGLFSGIDTTLVGNAALGEIGQLGDEALAALDRYQVAIGEAEAAHSATDPSRAVPPLARAVESLRAAGFDSHRLSDGVAGSGVGLDRKLALSQEALLSAAGVVLDARLLSDFLVPGGEGTVRLTIWNGGPFAVVSGAAEIELPTGWQFVQTSPGAEAQEIPPGTLSTFQFQVRPAVNAELSRPYFLRESPQGAIYRWPNDPGVRALPRDPPPLHANFEVRMLPVPGEAEVVVHARRPVRRFIVDPAIGEWSEPVMVVPQVSVRVTPSLLVLPTTLRVPSDVTVSLEYRGTTATEGIVRLSAPEGWSIEPEQQPFSFQGSGERLSVSFSVQPGGESATGSARLKATAVLGDGSVFEEGYQLVDYQHIDRNALFDEAVVEVERFDVEVRPGLRVGYIMGSGDAGDEALRQLGATVELLGPDRVTSGDFSGFDVLVLGVRAYATRADLAASNDAILAFARSGGTVVVQYNQYGYPAGGYAPYPVSISRPHDRVTDEFADVRVLEPEAPIFLTPNRIGPEDFSGWVQERGLYFLSEWGEPFLPLLEMSDPGEDPLQGSLLVAPVGEGLYIYTALAFFRQFARGVPGAFRLFANLVSLQGAEWETYLASGRGAADSGRSAPHDRF